MDRKRMKRTCCLRGALLLVVAAVIAAGVWMQMNRRNTKKFSETSEVFGNPLMGYAPCAWQEEVDEDINLLYVDITWRELEPEEGVYDWTQIEAENQLSPLA